MFPRKRELRNVCRVPFPFFSIFQLFSVFLFLSIFQFSVLSVIQYFQFLFTILLFFRTSLFSILQLSEFSIFQYFQLFQYFPIFSVLEQNQETSHWIRELIRSKQICSNLMIIFSLRAKRSHFFDQIFLGGGESLKSRSKKQWLGTM